MIVSDVARCFGRWDQAAGVLELGTTQAQAWRATSRAAAAYRVSVRGWVRRVLVTAEQPVITIMTRNGVRLETVTASAVGVRELADVELLERLPGGAP